MVQALNVRSCAKWYHLAVAMRCGHTMWRPCGRRVFFFNKRRVLKRSKFYCREKVLESDEGILSDLGDVIM